LSGGRQAFTAPIGTVCSPCWPAGPATACDTHHVVYACVAMRTNVDLNTRLVAEVMRRYRLRTKREAVDLALRRLVDEPFEPHEALALEGSGWDADLEELRESRTPPS
jgi:Arc/MetJ family transcription regulator